MDRKRLPTPFAQVAMAIIRWCTVAFAALAFFVSGCVSPILSAKFLATDNESAATPDREGSPSDNSPITSPQPSQTSEPLRSNAAVPPAESSNEVPKSANDPRDIRDVDQLIDSLGPSVPPQQRAYLREQFLAVAARQTQSVSLRDPIQPDQHPVDVIPVTHTAMSGPHEIPLTSPVRLDQPHLAPVTRAPELPTLPAAEVLPAPVPMTNPTADGNVKPNLLVSNALVPKVTQLAQPKANEWREQLANTLQTLEREVAKCSETDPEANVLATSARLLHVVANHREQAVAAIEKLDEDEREYWKHQLHALLVALDAEDKHVGGRWAALVLRELRAAEDHLSNISSLDVRNLAFCEKVDGFGNYSPFKTTAFKPGTDVCLYVEIDNFSVEQVGDHYRTELQAEYTITDGTGRRIKNKLPVAKEECRNRRHDYFISYVLTIPEDLPAGKYTLQLIVEDVIGPKSSQASIDFRVR